MNQQLNFGGGRGTSQWFTIRGMGQDQVDVKIDGAYTDAQLFHHQGRFMFDPSLLKRVDVQKGTGSSKCWNWSYKRCNCCRNS